MPKYGLLLVLLLAKTLAMEDPEPIFKAVGETLEMGFCFGVDYIAVYRINEGEKLLLWNSSDLFSTPDDYKNRVDTSNGQHELLGFQLMHLKKSDSGVYLRECWVDGNRTNQHINYLYMCDKEIPSQELFLKNGSAVLECDISYSEHDNTSIKWFREVYPGYKTTLFLDTEKSLELTEEELKTVLQVQNNGFSLYISATGLEHNQNFFCLVVKRGQCKYFKNIQLPETNKPEMQSVYYAVGEKAVLSCTSEHLSEQTQHLKHWKTPFGEVSATTPLSEMFTSNSEGNGDTLLVIPSITINHSGEYACFSQIIVSEYYITVCSVLVSNNVQLNSGEKVIMACTLTKDESVNILWYRQIYPMESQLIYDSEDPSINLPADIMDRTHIDSNASLIINEVNEMDSGTYWCVVLLDTVEGDINESLGNVHEENDNIVYDSEWVDEDDNTEICIMKRVTKLKVHSKNLTRSNEDYSPNPKTEPETSPVIYAVIGGVLGILILGLIVLCVLKMRTGRSAVDSRRAEPRAQKRNPAVSAPLMSL
ncbi:hypothetical protein Baya_2909 [Bagarius yarrelli]|uniref:Ig-like domain-containing protein n=1 Tax=Bagarius yarrelli TaxID=175774 RepID=A0A556TQY2_BAGYA|nr:hypothetical protein Baya_2909 [Bagarius yarrelli]